VLLILNRNCKSWPISNSHLSSLSSNIRLVSFFFRYQQMLHRNLVYLATIADNSQTAPNMLSVSTVLTIVDGTFVRHASSSELPVSVKLWSPCDHVTSCRTAHNYMLNRDERKPKPVRFSFIKIGTEPTLKVYTKFWLRDWISSQIFS